MLDVKIVDGDFPAGDYNFDDWECVLFNAAIGKKRVQINLAANIKSMEKLGENQTNRLGRAAGLGAAGAIVAGPAGLIVGGLLGGKKTLVHFLMELKSGETLIAVTSPETYAKIYSMKNKTKADIYTKSKKVAEQNKLTAEQNKIAGTELFVIFLAFFLVFMGIILFIRFESPPAQLTLDKLSEDQLSEAQQRASDWKPKPEKQPAQAQTNKGP